MTLVAVLTMSLLGSVHCAGMCGPFVLACGGPRRGAGLLLPLAAYNGGRLLSYLTLGLLAGAAGQAIDGAAEAFLGVQRAAAVLMGVVLILMALSALGLTRRLRLSPTAPSRALAPRLRRALGALYRRKDATGTFAVGLLSALLPCGWLWGFVAIAGASASPVWGAATMGAFWLGTVPILAATGLAAGGLNRLLGPYAPRALAIAMLAVGVLALTGRMPMPSLDGSPAKPACCQDAPTPAPEGPHHR